MSQHLRNVATFDSLPKLLKCWEALSTNYDNYLGKPIALFSR